MFPASVEREHLTVFFLLLARGFIDVALQRFLDWMMTIVVAFYVNVGLCRADNIIVSDDFSNSAADPGNPPDSTIWSTYDFNSSEYGVGDVNRPTLGGTNYGVQHQHRLLQFKRRPGASPGSAKPWHRPLLQRHVRGAKRRCYREWVSLEN